MKKMLASLVVGLLCYAPVSAQNFPNRYDTYGIGAPNFTLNSGGSSYGQLFNYSTASQWSLGSGTSQSTSGTASLSWRTDGSVVVGSTVSFAQGGALIVYSTSSNVGTAILNVRDQSDTSVLLVLQDGGTVPKSRTLAQLTALAPYQVGETFYCSDCSPKKLVLSTGTSASNFSDASGGTFK